MTEDTLQQTVTKSLIAPHGGSLVDRTGERPGDLDSLETLTLTPREVADLDMLASGALSPLEGFMSRDDYERVVEDMHLANGLAWALPVCLAVEAAPTGDRVALADGGGRPLAVLEVEEVFEYDKESEAERCFRTTDEAHPGVARLYAQHPLYLAGKVTVFVRPDPPFPELALDPADTRKAFEERGWRRVVGFQTRNPIHRAHEYLTKGALETVDGLLIHPLVGETKSDDVPAATRVECYRVLVDNYYPADRVIVSAFPAAMRYAGPREAIWHAHLPQELRLLALHRRPRPRGRRRLLRHVRRAADLRRVRAARARDRADVLRARVLVQAPAARWRRRRRVRTAATTTCSCPGRRCASCSQAGELPPVEFSRPEVAEVLIDAYR